MAVWGRGRHALYLYTSLIKTQPDDARTQVATDTRLWLYGALQDTRVYLADLIKTAVVRAEADVDVLMPGFTHLQVGVPSFD